MAHLHNITDDELSFLIDAKTRRITTQSGTGLKLIQFDHNSERFTFEVPRYIEGHDMSECSKVELHFNNISADKKNQSRDIYLVDDIKVSPDSDDIVVFSWLISGAATKYAGILAFLVRFVCLNGADVEYAWHTDVYRDIPVGEGMNNGEAVLVEYSDVIAAWEKRVTFTAKQYTDAQVDDLKRVDAALEQRVRVLEGGILNYDEVISQTREIPVPADSVEMAFINEVGNSRAKVSKNLLDPALFGTSVNNLGQVYYTGNSAILSAFVTLPAGTYTLSSDVDVFISRGDLDSEFASQRTFTLSSESEIEICLAGDAYGWEEPFYTSIMLNPGSTVLPFEPYGNQDAVKVTAIESYDKDSKLIASYSIPKAVQDVPEYECGYIDFNNKKFIQPEGTEGETLDPPLETDISEHLKDYGTVLPIPVQPGGKLRLVSEADAGTRSKITFVSYKA